MTYEDYYNQWQLSTESRDLAFDEWLCLRLDKQNDHLREVKKMVIDKAKEAFCKSICIGYQETNSCFADGGCSSYRKFMKELNVT